MPFGACDHCRKYFAIGGLEAAVDDLYTQGCCPACDARLRACEAAEALSFMAGRQHAAPDEFREAEEPEACGLKGGGVDTGDLVTCHRGRHLSPPGKPCPFCLQETQAHTRALAQRLRRVLPRLTGEPLGSAALADGEAFPPLPREPLVTLARAAVVDAETPPTELADLPRLMRRFYARQAALARAHALELRCDAEEVCARSQALVRESRQLRGGERARLSPR